QKCASAAQSTHSPLQCELGRPRRRTVSFKSRLAVRDTQHRTEIWYSAYRAYFERSPLLSNYFDLVSDCAARVGPIFPFECNVTAAARIWRSGYSATIGFTDCDSTLPHYPRAGTTTNCTEHRGDRSRTRRHRSRGTG